VASVAEGRRTHGLRGIGVDKDQYTTGPGSHERAKRVDQGVVQVIKVTKNGASRVTTTCNSLSRTAGWLLADQPGLLKAFIDR
jgi:basic membrane lipoprotein Med (substrate-binding protein (PBP1-ABC) superfamily)